MPLSTDNVKGLVHLLERHSCIGHAPASWELSASLFWAWVLRPHDGGSLVHCLNLTPKVGCPPSRSLWDPAQASFMTLTCTKVIGLAAVLTMGRSDSYVSRLWIKQPCGRVPRETEPIGDMGGREELSYRNWLIGLWRLSSPTVCHPTAGAPGQPVVQVRLSPKA